MKRKFKPVKNAKAPRGPKSNREVRRGKENLRRYIEEQK